MVIHNLVPASIEFSIFFGFLFTYRNELYPYSSTANIRCDCGIDEKNMKLYIPQVVREERAEYKMNDTEFIATRFGDSYASIITTYIKNTISGASLVRRADGEYDLDKTTLRKYDNGSVRVNPIGLSDVTITIT